MSPKTVRRFFCASEFLTRLRNLPGFSATLVTSDEDCCVDFHCAIRWCAKSKPARVPSTLADLPNRLLADERHNAPVRKCMPASARLVMAPMRLEPERLLLLRSSEVRSANPAALLWVLRNGSLRRGMPSFAHLSEARRWQIITYLKSLATYSHIINPIPNRIPLYIGRRTRSPRRCDRPVLTQ